MAEPICCEIRCDGELTEELLFDGELDMEMDADGECGVYHRVSSYEAYSGPYEVTPRFEDQHLATREKLMLNDVTVDAITVSRVSNPAGGKTVFIGGQIDYA